MQQVQVERVINPTLLSDENEYESIIAPKIENEKYLLLYARRWNDKMNKFAEKMAKENNCKIVEISLQATN